jgi:hypothetical protein
MGLLLVWTRSFFSPDGKDRPWLRWAPVASSFLVLSIGIILLARAILQHGRYFGTSENLHFH